MSRPLAPPRHVVVCGAGVIGASTAYFLARRGVAVTVVERSGVACAASGKSGGFLALDWCDASPLGPLARASFALHAELARALGTDYGYRRVDTFMLAARERGPVTGGHRVPTPPRWLDGAGVVTAALGSTDTTAQVHPARFTTALIDAAQAHGATLHIGRVDDVIQRDGAVCGVMCPRMRCSSTAARPTAAASSRRSFLGPTATCTSAGWRTRRRCRNHPMTSR